MTEAYIYDAVRTPRGKGRKDGALHEVTSARLAAVSLNALVARNNLTGHSVEDVILGNVTQVGEQGGCLARTAVLASDLDESVPGLSINRFCASGMEAVNLAANQVRGGAGVLRVCYFQDCDGGWLEASPERIVDTPSIIRRRVHALTNGFACTRASRPFSYGWSNRT